MPQKKEEAGRPDSPFRSAAALYAEGRAKPENRKRFERWADDLVRQKKIPADWKDDAEAGRRAGWIDGKSPAPPATVKRKR